MVTERREPGQLIDQDTEMMMAVMRMMMGCGRLMVRMVMVVMMVMVVVLLLLLLLLLPSAVAFTELVYDGVSLVELADVVVVPVKLFHSNVKLLDRLPSSELRWSKLRLRNRLGDRRPGEESDPMVRRGKSASTTLYPDVLTVPDPVGSSGRPSVILCSEPPSKVSPEVVELPGSDTSTASSSEALELGPTCWCWCCSTSSGSPSPSSSSSSSSILPPPVPSAVSTSMPTSPSTLSPGPSACGHRVAVPVDDADDVESWCVWLTADSRLFALAPFGPTVLKPNLNACLGEIDAYCELLAEEHVRVVRSLEGTLELLQLERVECRPASCEWKL
uniref:Uncharacterized protein n=1 Tax=Anopheles maculatus TaxID=74869 RepID=A0A182SFG1_9DIPT